MNGKLDIVHAPTRDTGGTGNLDFIEVGHISRMKGPSQPGPERFPEVPLMRRRLVDP